MVDRSVVLRLKAEIADFKRQMTDAKKAAQSVGDGSEDAAKRSDTALGQMVASARKNEEAWTKVGTSMLGIGAAAAAGVGIAVAKFADFDQAMSHVQAATHETASNMSALREAAIDAGAATQYSATEAAGAIENLAKAGVSTTDILNGGLDGALDLAAAGTIDVADAADIAATALNQFHLKGGDVAHVADLLAAGAGKAQGGVGDLGMALKQTGLVADQTGLTIEETTAGLSAFASAGLIGSDAGTSFKSMLQRLTPQSKEAQKAMDDLGISAYDEQGQFIGLAKFAGNLQGALKDLTPEQRNSTLATIFGSDAVRAASVLYDQGEQGIRDWTAAVDDAGYAATTAAMNTDNLRGDIERLGGSLDTALIKTGEGSNGVLRSMTQALTSAIDAYGAASPVVQNMTLIVGAATAAVGLLGGGFLTLAPRIIATRVAMATLATDMPKTTKFFGGLGKAAGIAGAAFGIIQLTDALVGLASGARGAVTDTEAVQSVILELDGVKTNNLFAVGDGINGVTEALDALMGGGFEQKANRTAATLDTVFGTSIISEVSNSRKAFQSFDEGLASLVQSGHAEEAAAGLQNLYSQVDQSKYSIDDLKKLLPGYADALAGVANEQTLTKEATTQGTTAVVEQTDALQDLIDGMNTLSGIVLSERDAQRALEAAYDDASAAIEKNGATLDITTEAGRANQSALDDIAKSGYDLVESMKANGATQDELQASLQGTRDNFIQVAQQMGLSADEANALADELKLIPADISTNVVIDTNNAAVTIDQFIRNQSARSIQLRVDANPSYVPLNSPNSVRRAAGGPVYGAGTSTSDSIPALLSNGEYVIKAAAVDQYGTGFFDNLNAQRFAVGGPVGNQVSSGAAAAAGPAVVNHNKFYVSTPDPAAASLAITRRLNNLGA